MLTATASSPNSRAKRLALGRDRLGYELDIIVREILDCVRGGVAERRADAVLAMYDHLREHGEAENDTLAELVDPDAVDYKHADSIWSNLVKGKETLRALPGVEPPPPSVDKPWRYRSPTDDGEREGDE